MNRRLQFIVIILGILLIAVLLVPFSIPITPLEGVESEIALAGPDSRFLTIQFPGTNGVALHYLDSGSGPIPAILLHSEGSDLYEWSAVTETLSTRMRTIAYDRPPFGLSEHTIPQWSGESPYTTHSSMNMLFTMMDDLSIPQAVLVAGAGSARIALEAALARPDRVRGLVLVAPEVYGSSQSIYGLVGSIPQVDRLGPLLVRGRADEQRAMFRRLVADPSILDQATLDKLDLTFKVQNWDRAVWESTKAYTPDNFSGRLDSLHLPVLILAGDSDPVVPFQAQQKLAAEIPGARLEVIKSSGHLPHLEHPSEVSKLLDLFASQVALSG